MNRLLIRLLRLSLPALVTLAPLTARAAVPILPVCGWPFESNGQGITNVATPDTNATYWVMPFDTANWKAMIIQGTYPEARFFNFNSYTATGAVTDSIIDSDIAPDPGSTNPFATPIAGGRHTYSLSVSTTPSGSGNMLRVGGSRLAFVVYRVYLPDQGLDRTGAVGLPEVRMVAPDGRVRRLRPCPFADAETSLGNLAIALAISGFNDAAQFLQRILAAAQLPPPITGLCNPNQPGPSTVPFAPPTAGTEFFANPQTTYLETPGFCFQQGKVLVVHGKALVYPNTYAGGSIFEPAFDGAVQIRYWSMCNNGQVPPYRVIACQADHATDLDTTGSYTYVVSDDPVPPPWLPANTTWLTWGPTVVPKNLIFRTISGNSQAGPFTVPDEYYPHAVFCPQQVFVQGGWQACFQAAGAGP